MAIAVRSCSEKNKRGKPCANPVVGENGLCPAHDPDHVVSRRFAAGPDHTIGPGAPRLIRSIERMQQLEDEHFEELARVHVDVALSPEVEAHLRMKAVEYIHARFAGTPTARTEVEHSGRIGLDVLLGELPNLDTTNERFTLETPANEEPA